MDNNINEVRIAALDITSEEELMDIRVDGIGYIHESAGDATRSIHSNLLQVIGGLHNLYNGKHTKVGTTLNSKTGELENRTTTGIVSDWIPAKPATTYSHTITSDKTVGWSIPYFYDADKKFISAASVAFSPTYTTPANSYFLRFIGNSFRIDGHDVQINEGVTLLPFDGYTPFIRSDYIADAMKEVFELDRKTYYVSQYGDDNNGGCCEQFPKKTLRSVNNFSDCTILLKSGEEFTLDAPDMLYFMLGDHCILSSYGGIAKPLINGYINLELGWTKYSDNIYKASLKNKGFYEGSTEQYDLGNVGHLLVDGQYNAKRVETLDTLAKEGEYYIDEANIEIYYYTSLSIIDFKFQAARNSHAIYIYNSDNTTVSGIEIKGFGKHGIWIRDSKNIRINNSYVHHIGGCKISKSGLRYGNGIEVWDNGENILIEDNHVTDVFDAGITNQTTSAKVQKNIKFSKNIVERCWYAVEVFDGIGTTRATYQNIVYENNILMDTTDITKGYRFNAGQISCALFKVYCTAKNKLLLKDNIAYLAHCYLIYSPDNNGLAGITFDGNIYIQYEENGLFHPTSHNITDKEQLIIVVPIPDNTDEYSKKAYALALINNKRLSF